MNTMHENPHDAEAAFYRAFAERNPAGMRSVWADGPHTLCVHPGGSLLRGTAEILQSWDGILTNVSVPEVNYEQVNVLQEGDLAIHTVRETIRPAISADAPTTVISTNIYQKTALGWRMVTHHASLPLVDQRKAARNLH